MYQIRIEVWCDVVWHYVCFDKLCLSWWCERLC